MHPLATSLTDPPADSPIAEGVTWVQGVALGTTATAIAVLAVATIGLLMLSGRFEVRRGITVLIGCFILLGVRGIASEITEMAEANSDTEMRAAPQTFTPPRTPPGFTAPPSAYDPYAGASVPTAR